MTQVDRNEKALYFGMACLRTRVLLSNLLLALACGDDSAVDAGSDVGVDGSGQVDAGVDTAGDADISDAAGDTSPFDASFDALSTLECEESARTRLRVATFNTGTTLVMGDDAHPDGYTEAKAAISDEFYGDGLAWRPAVDAVRTWLAAVQPDVIVFQEMFYSEECDMVPADARAGFVCETFAAGDPTVAQVVLGEGYQIACNLGKPDKCAAVRTAVGSFVGCDTPLCIDGLDGARVPDCGGGSRVGRGVIELVAGGTVTVVNLHGTSGLSAQDQSCRVQQFEQVFVDLGDGNPGANGRRNLVMGDLNSDPFRSLPFDESAMLLAELVGEGLPFRFITEVGPDAPGSYAGAFDIDHVMSDTFAGSCWIGGLSEGHEVRVYEPSYFDHMPVVCDVESCD